MLFDLRGSGRRTTVKAVYILLAVLMGGGLILFGIGGSVSGGLVDAITEGGNSANTSVDSYRKHAQELEAKARANPKDAAAWAAATRARFQLAGAGDFVDQATGQFNAEGKAQLAAAGKNWERYLALDPKKPDDSVASLMVQAYGQAGLSDPAKAVTAQEIITEARPGDKTFATLAFLAYQAGQTRKGDLATQRALEEADPADRKTLKSDLQNAKQQALAQQAQQGTTPTPVPTPTPSSTKKQKKSGGGSG
jgi:hypothetical protein